MNVSEKPNGGASDRNKLQPGRFLSVSQMYDTADSERFMNIFPGGFINFGYWAGLQNEPFNVATRIRSQQNMYLLALNKLGVTHSTQDTILDVGCGKGKGLELLYDRFQPRGRIIGTDFHPQQVVRTKETLVESPGEFVIFQNPAENLWDINDKSIDRALSVESIQHFESPQRFIGELERVVRPGGRIAVASLFSVDSEAQQELKKIVLTVENKIDKAYVTTDVQQMMDTNGFTDIESTSIKHDVFPYFTRWLEKVIPDSPSLKWRDAYEQGLLDYNVITANAPV